MTRLFELEECVICGCTDDRACEGGCHWVAPGLCSSCADKIEGVFNHIITSVGKDPRGTPFAPNMHHTQEEAEYLVRYQVQEWPYERVAEEYHVDVERVKQVCKEISSILGMELRGESEKRLVDIGVADPPELELDQVDVGAVVAEEDER
jgi:hypothetical protein